MRHLPAAQLEIMLVIWEAEAPVTRSAIQNKLPDDRWKTTTLNTFLNRLTQSGFLQYEHRGKEYVYSPLIQKEDYMEYEGKSLLKSLYDNSINKFVASVCSSGSLTEEEVNDLQSLLAKLKEGDKDDPSD